MLSSQVVQQDEESWLQAYTRVLDAASDEEIRRENREDYRDQSQTYADYLDYKEDWQYAADQAIQDMRKSYIHRLAVTRQNIQCECGATHQLKLYGDEQPGIAVDDPQTIPYVSCWFRTINTKIQTVRELLETGAANFPDVITHRLVSMTRWVIAKNDMTPTLLPYDVYREVWWDLDHTGSQTERSKYIMSLLNSEDKTSVYQKATEIRRPEVQRYFFTTEDVVEDHGFHAFIQTRSDACEIISYLNRMRRKVGFYQKNITKQMVDSEIERCATCQMSRVSGLSPFGIYAAPPGAGKSTAQHKGLLVGFDTDWVGIGPTWRDYSYLLKKSIPIITNQPKLFMGSGVKIQFALKDAIRKDNAGKPMGNYNSLRTWALEHTNDVVLYDMARDQFLTSVIVQMTFTAHMQQVNLCLMLNKRSMYDVDPDWLNAFGKRMRRAAKGDYGVR